MSNNLNNLEEKISLLYNYLYDKINSKYTLNNIKENEIDISDIKITNDKSKNDFIDFLLNGNFKLLSENNLLLKNFNDNLNLLFLIKTYNKNDNLDKINNNKDALFSYILSSLLLQKKTIHILCPIINLDISFEKMLDILKPYSIFKSIINDIEENNIQNMLSLNVKEGFYQSKILSDYIKTKQCSVKFLFFQVIHTILTIQKNYKNFKHNKLDINNILVYLKKQDSNNFNIYSYDNKKYYLQDCDFDIKIFNFEHSYLSTISDLKDSNIPNYNKNNNYSDIHYFFNTLLYTYNYQVNKNDKELIEFLDYVIPKKLRGKGKNNYYLEENKEFVKVDKILEHKYFKNLLNKKSISNYMETNKYYFGNRKLNKEKKGIKLVRNFANIKKKSNNYNNINMIGGGNPVNQAPYTTEKNDPFITNEQRSIYKRSMEDKPKPRELQKLAEQVVYQQPQAAPQQQGPPSYIPISDNMNAMPMPYYVPLDKESRQIPVQKNYHIHLTQPTKGHTMLNRIYEDMLPANPYPYSFISVKDRKNLIKFIRSIIIDSNDGEEMTVIGGLKSFLSHIKLLKFNPYSLSPNPYRDLAKDFMLFNAAYPVRYNSEKELIELDKTSMGVNVRIYKLSVGAYKCNQLNSRINCNDFDVWREINYYNYIKSNVTDRLESPNFVNQMLYKIDIDSNIDWNELSNLKRKDMPNEDLQQLIDNDRMINRHVIDPQNPALPSNVIRLLVSNNNNAVKMHYANVPEQKNHHYQLNVMKDSLSNLQNEIVLLASQPINDENLRKISSIKKKFGRILSRFKTDENHGDTKTLPELVNDLYETQGELNYLQGVQNRDQNQNNRLTALRQKLTVTLDKIQRGETTRDLEEVQVDLTEDSGKSLVSLTEAPTYNLLEWGSPKYEVYGTISKMIATGHHTEKEWDSIIFQIIYACAVLQKHKIHFSNFSVTNNVFIKDLYKHPSETKHWIFKVNGVEYYVPNYGHLIVIDSRYTDILPKIPTIRPTAYQNLPPRVGPSAAPAAVIQAGANTALITGISKETVIAAIVRAATPILPIVDELLNNVAGAVAVTVAVIQTSLQTIATNSGSALDRTVYTTFNTRIPIEQNLFNILNLDGVLPESSRHVVIAAATEFISAASTSTSIALAAARAPPAPALVNAPPRDGIPHAYPQQKIYSSKVYGDSENSINNWFEVNTFYNLKEALDYDNLQYLINERKGFIPEEITNKLRRLNNFMDNMIQSRDYDIKNIFFELYKNTYLNNKIGDNLTQFELENVDFTSPIDTIADKGKLLAYQYGPNNYRWVLLKNIDLATTQFNVIDKENEQVRENRLNRRTIYRVKQISPYVPSNVIDKEQIKLDEASLIEKYTLD
jgi:hypothetical protein